MLELCRVCSIWKEPHVAREYLRGVSLHSHTSASKETLGFIHEMFLERPWLRPLFRYFSHITLKRRGIVLDYETAHWCPPLQPRMAYELESRQLWELGLEPMVSIGDHDTIEAPMLLRTLNESGGIPMSVEWTAPFGQTVFHLGIHNLPSADAAAWMARLQAYTKMPDERLLDGMLRELHDIPQVLLVMNHPLWDLYKTGELHRKELNRFMAEHGSRVHALELNGLRNAHENRDVVALAERWNQVLISGGDRHGMEPNAVINLTNAANFTEFVREVRVERRSCVMYLAQYRKPWEQRIVASTLDAVTDHPHFAPGWQRWDERGFHADAQGEMRPMAELWTRGKAPIALRFAIACVKVLSGKRMGGALRWAFVSKEEQGEVEV